MTRPEGTVLTLAARWIMPVESEPVADCCMDIRGDQILQIGPRQGRLVDLDYGNAALLPGLVNAHCHLELEPLEGDTHQLMGEPENEVAWLQRVVNQRWVTDPESYAETAARHVRELLQSGTTLVADITTAGASGPALVESPMRSVIFSEVIGLKRLRAMATNEAAWAWINAVEPALKRDKPADGSFQHRIGLSPHAPYSTAGWIYHQVAGTGVPLTTHLAEMPEELELLEHGTGPLRGFLESIGAWPEADEWRPIGPKPLDYVRHRELRGADWLIAHANYIDDKDLWMLSPAALKPDQRVAVAYCPRTAHRFGHRDHPFQKLLQRGAIVCLGTDSRASSPSLSVLDEMRFLRGQHPALSAKLILAMGTLFGAWALRADHFCGSLKPGKKADLAIVALPNSESPPTADPIDLVLSSELPVVATWAAGKPAFELS